MWINTLTKIQVSAVPIKQDRRIIFLPKFIDNCMETPCWCPSRWAPTWRPESNRKIFHLVLLQKRELFSFYNRWTIQIAKFPLNSHFFNQHDSSLSRRHVNAAASKSCEAARLRARLRSKYGSGHVPKSSCPACKPLLQRWRISQTPILC